MNVQNIRGYGRSPVAAKPRRGKMGCELFGDGLMESGTDLILRGSDSASVGEYVFLWLVIIAIIVAGLGDISRSGK